MIPLCVPNLNGNEREYLNQCIDTTFVSNVGPFVGKFEEKIADSAGVSHAVATSAGTTALHIALIACGVGKDDLVMIPSYTFIATANAISHCGAIPLLVDVEKKNWTISTALLRQELEQNSTVRNGILLHKPTNRRIAAIMPVYTLGNVADMEEINLIAQDYSLPVIADAAAAIGAVYKGNRVGGLADATTFSFNGNKTITSGGGGAVVTKEESLAKKIRHLLSTARIGIEYDHDMVGYNYRMTNIEAAVGLAQIEQLDSFLNKKREIRAFYNMEFGRINGIELFPDRDMESVCWFSGIVMENAAAVHRMIDVLKRNDIEGRSFWKPMHLQLPYKDCPKTDVSFCGDLWDRVLTLPSSTGITSEELQKVARVVKQELS